MYYHVAKYYHAAEKFMRRSWLDSTCLLCDIFATWPDSRFEAALLTPLARQDLCRVRYVDDNTIDVSVWTPCGQEKPSLLPVN
jgi:hypothetical protein